MDALSTLQQGLGEQAVKQNEPLQSLTTLKVGGPAAFFYRAASSEAVVNAVQAANKAQIPYYIIGGGSNIVISDKGFQGLVIKNDARQIKIVKRLGSVKNGKSTLKKALVEADTGALINQLVRFLCDEGLGGLERHLGLPGTVGGALYMNSKWTRPATYVGDVLYHAAILTQDGKVKQVDNSYFNFDYDQSILQKTKDTVLTATFLLTSAPTTLLWQRAQASLAYRKATQPIGVPSAGCTFRNISLSDAMRINTPNHTTSAGYLVDRVGLKGYRHGGARFSDIHANFILNDKGATAQDVKALIDEAKTRVKQKYQVEIEPEIVLVGEFD